MKIDSGIAKTLQGKSVMNNMSADTGDEYHYILTCYARYENKKIVLAPYFPN